MSANPTAKPHHGSIDVGDPQSLAYWSQHWGITSNQLRRAIRQVGTDVAELAAYLGRPAQMRIEPRRGSGP